MFIIIPVAYLPGVLITLGIMFTGLDHLSEPAATIFKRKGFDFADAMVETTLGLIELIVGFVAFLFVIASI